MAARILSVAERLGRDREWRVREAARDGEAAAMSTRLEDLIFRVEMAISRQLSKPRPNTKWLGERLVLRDRLADLFLSLDPENRLWPEDHCFF